MATLELTDDQVLQLVKQLPARRQQDLLRSLLGGQWSTWEKLPSEGEVGARRAAAQRGLNWDAMSEEQRESFIDDVVHEDRACIGDGTEASPTAMRPVGVRASTIELAHSRVRPNQQDRPLGTTRP